MEETVSLYMDFPNWEEGVKVDDFIVAIGVKKSNSVYHVAEVKPPKLRPNRMKRYYMKVYRSDLLTALQRDPEQNLIPIYWYKRNKKK